MPYKLLITGLQGSGKTHLMKYEILPRKPDHLILNPQRGKEYLDKYNRVYKFRYIDDFDKLHAELSLVLKKMVYPNLQAIESKKKKNKKILKDLVIEEADLFLPPRKQPAFNIRELMTSHGHYNLNLYFLTRRITDVHTYVHDTADFIIAFKQTGSNTLKRLNEIMKGAKESMETEIDYDRHNFLFFPRDRSKYFIANGYADVKQYLEEKDRNAT